MPGTQLSLFEKLSFTMKSNLIQFISSFPAQGIHEIKLKDLLNLREPEQATREIRTMFPPVTIGSVTLVDQIVLLCLDELVAPSHILEIGTFQGFTTRLLARNSVAHLIYSVDLPPTDTTLIDTLDKTRILCDGSYNDNHLRDIQNRSGEIYLKDLTLEEMKRIQLIKADSTSLDFSNKFLSIEFAFIDGGHDYEIICRDTENVLRVMKNGVIIWHDFSSTIHSDVTRYLSARAIENRIFHVKGSLCAFQFIRC